MRKIVLVSCLFLFGFSLVSFAESANLKGNTLFTAISQILKTPEKYRSSFVSVKASFEGWRKADGPPPVTRSDWVAVGEDGAAIYCTGSLPMRFSPDDPSCWGRQINILAKVELTPAGKPYLNVFEALPFLEKPELMVSVSQILFDPIGMRGKRVGLLGVLAKGYGTKGQRLYLLADPTGAITLERLPKLYPKGTILQIKGTVGSDENGLPLIQNVEIVSAKL